MAEITPCPQKIVHYFPHIHLAMGGVVRAVLDWCAVMAARGNFVTLATFDAPDVPADWDGSAGKPAVAHLNPARRFGLLPAEAIARWEALLGPAGAAPPAVAHLHTPWLVSNVQIARTCRRLGIPYVVSIHGMLDDWAMAQKPLKKRLYLQWVGSGFLHRAGSLHYAAEEERDQAQRQIPHPHSTVLPNMVDLGGYQRLPEPELARKTFRFDATTPILLFVGRLQVGKGVHLLIEAVELLRRDGHPVKLLIAGPAAPADQQYEHRLREAVQSFGLCEQVKFLGLVTGEAKVSLYQAADLFVLPSEHENFGIVLIEAMSAGTAVLTTRGTHIWREIQSAGAVICERDAAALARSIAELIGDRRALSETGARLRKWALRRFNTDALAAEYEALYCSLLGRT